MAVTNAGLAAISGLVGGVDAQTAFSYLALGTGNTTFTAADIILATEILVGVDSGLVRVSATVTRVTTTQTNDTIQFYKVFTAAATTTVKEVGVFNHATAGSGTLLARTVLSTTRALEANFTYALTYKVKFAAA